MASLAAARPLTLIRWVVALTNLAICVVLIVSILHPVSGHPQFIPTLSLIAIALCAYAWVLFPTGGSILVSVIVLLSLIWLWGAQGGNRALGINVAVLVLLLTVAAVQQRSRARRFKRFQQLLDDLAEEQTVKDQAIAFATQTKDALQRKHSRYTQLQAIADELSGLMELEAIAQLAVERAFALIGKSDACLLFLIDTDRQELSLFASKKRESLPSVRAKHGDQFDRHVLRTHRPLLVNDVRRDFRFTVTVSPERSVSSVIACPLLLGESPEGVLRLDSAQPGAYTQDDLRFLDILLDLVATAMTNARLFAQTQQLAMTDGLTGLTLRRPFLEALTRELLRAGRRRESTSVLMLDIDHFKAYNDTFGHSAGDLILKSVSQVLRETVPAGGVVARYGGEEFTVLLPRLGRVHAIEIAERIRTEVASRVQSGWQGSARPASAFAATRQADEGEPMTPTAPSSETAVKGSVRSRRIEASSEVTVSVGVVTAPDDAQADLELIRIADTRLYAAKHAGRNLVCSSS